MCFMCRFDMQSQTHIHMPCLCLIWIPSLRICFMYWFGLQSQYIIIYMPIVLWSVPHLFFYVAPRLSLVTSYPFLCIYSCASCVSVQLAPRLHVCFGLLYSCVWTYIYVALPAEAHGVLPISYELWDVNSHHACYYLMLVFGMWIRPLSYSDDLSCLYYIPCNDPFNLSL